MNKKAGKLPTCIGIIMDGNRRWAKENGLPTLKGHQKGYSNFKKLTEWVRDTGVKNLIVYAFSTENWHRSEEEVSYLLSLFQKVVKEELDELKKQNVRVLFAGDLTRFPNSLRELMQKAQEETKDNDGCCLVIAASYGGRAEIVHALKEIQRSAAEEEITEELIAQHLWISNDIPDPDLIIRTGGEKRLSGFLPWQSVYSELFFVDTYWPDFSKEEFDRILAEYAKREQRYGK